METQTIEKDKARMPVRAGSEGNDKVGQEQMSPELLNKMNAYWRAANYLSVGQIYLHENPLLREPLKPENIKNMLLGHWGTTPGQNFIYVHLNRIIKKYDLDMIYISGPGHGGPAIVGNVYLRALTAKYIRISAGMMKGYKNYLHNFHFPAAFQAMYHLSVLVLFMKVVSLVIPSAMLSGQFLIILV
jgi:phosphoketolase